MEERCIYFFYYYIENNYMFRRLIMAIFRLYMNRLVSSYTHTHIYIYIYICVCVCVCVCVCELNKSEMIFSCPLVLSYSRYSVAS